MSDQVDERTDQTPPGDDEPAGRAGRAGPAESSAAGAAGPARRDQAGAGPEGEADREAGSEAGAGGGDGPREPTRVESSAERARRDRLARDPRRAAPHSGRPRDRFDDWDDR